MLPRSSTGAVDVLRPRRFALPLVKARRARISVESRRFRFFLPPRRSQHVARQSSRARRTRRPAPLRARGRRPRRRRVHRLPRHPHREGPDHLRRRGQQAGGESEDEAAVLGHDRALPRLPRGDVEGRPGLRARRRAHEPPVRARHGGREDRQGAGRAAPRGRALRVPRLPRPAPVEPVLQVPARRHREGLEDRRVLRGLPPNQGGRRDGAGDGGPLHVDGRDRQPRPRPEVRREGAEGLAAPAADGAAPAKATTPAKKKK